MPYSPPRSPRITAGAAAVVAAALLSSACGAGASREVAARGAASQVKGSQTHSEVQRELAELEKSRKVRIGAFALDTATGKTVSYRGNERFPLLSTFKAMLCSAVLHQARTTEPGLLNKRLHWTKDDLVPHSPQTGTHEALANGLTVAELCKATITQSDNTAANVLLKEIGGPEAVTAHLRSLGDRTSRLDHNETDLNVWHPGSPYDTTEPAAIGSDLHKTTIGGALVAQDAKTLQGWMLASVTGDKRIRAGLPGWKVGDKTGTGGHHGAANDIAIAWPQGSDKPLIIAIYTNGPQDHSPNDDTAIARTATVLAHGLGKTA